MAPWMAQRRLGMCSVCQAIQHIIAVWRVAHTISAPHHACACRLHIHAYLLPSSSLGPHSRRPSLASAVQHVTTCRASGSGALRRPAFSFLDISRLFRAAVASLLPWSARTLVSSNPPPPFAPVSPGLSLCGSLSYSLPSILSCSPLLFLSCCTSLFLSHCALPSLSLSLSLCFSLPLSRALSLAPKKGGFGLFGASLSPPGFEPSSTGQERCGVSTGPRRWVICTMAPCAPLFFSFLSPPVMRIFFRMGVCSAVCRGTAQRPRVPGPPA